MSVDILVLETIFYYLLTTEFKLITFVTLKEYMCFNNIGNIFSRLVLDSICLHLCCTSFTHYVLQLFRKLRTPIIEKANNLVSIINTNKLLARFIK